MRETNLSIRQYSENLEKISAMPLGTVINLLTGVERLKLAVRPPPLSHIASNLVVRPLRCHPLKEPFRQYSQCAHEMGDSCESTRYSSTSPQRQLAASPNKRFALSTKLPAISTSEFKETNSRRAPSQANTSENTRVAKRSEFVPAFNTPTDFRSSA